MYAPSFNQSTGAAIFQPLRANVYFAGRVIWADGAPAYQDRLGTNRAQGARFLPYGNEITSTTNDREKFATYTRDSYTGLDYAQQRFYASTYGRFNSADPYAASAGPNDPSSWNRYTYVGGDPVNRVDPKGTDWCDGEPTEGTALVGCDSWCGSGYLLDPVTGVGCVPFGALYFVPPGTPGGGGGSSPPPPTCEQTEESWLTGYLDQDSPDSPLLAMVDAIVTQSDAAGIDDRFIVALAGQESSYGTNVTRGPFNAWNNLAHTANRSPYSSWSASLTGVESLLTGRLYFGAGKTTVGSIYGTYNNSNLSVNPKYPKQLKDLTNIYVGQMGGDLIPDNPQEVDFSRCP